MTKRTIASALGLMALVAVTSAGLSYAQVGEGGQGLFKKGGRPGPEKVIEVLGLDVDTVKTQLEAGSTIKEVIEAAGFTQDDVKEAMDDLRDTRIADAVASGKITQEQADEKIAKMEEMRAKHEAIRQAMENNDYAAWSALVADGPMGKNIDEATFSTLSQAHALRESGDKEGARALLDEAGIKPPHKGKHSKGFGEGKLGFGGEREGGSGFGPRAVHN